MAVSSVRPSALPHSAELRGRRGRRAAILAGIAALGAAALAGAAATTRYGPLLVLLGVLIAAIAVGIRSWRVSIVCLLAYLPFSGLLPLALYPATAPGVLAKDLLFVIPAYGGAMVAIITRRERFSLPGFPTVVFAMFTCLIFLQAFNPLLEKPLLGLIGIKVWLFYVPMLFLGYHLFRTREELQRVLRWMLLIAMVPCVIGILEAGLIASGQRDLVYGAYGDAAAAATQEFAAFSLGGGGLTRIPSIFQFIAQYWLFSTAAMALGYAAWRGNRGDPLLRMLGPLCIATAAVASLTCGLRGAFIVVPGILLIIGVLEGARIGPLLGLAAGSLAMIASALLLIKADSAALADLTYHHLLFILDFFKDGIDFGLREGIGGLGTGVDSVAARYAYDSAEYGVVYRVLGGVWYESWYLRALIELGIIGLALLAVFVVALLRRSLRAHAAVVHDPELRSMSAAFLALFLFAVVYALKTAYIEIDPLTIYVWLFLGVQWRLSTLGREEDATPTIDET